MKLSDKHKEWVKYGAFALLFVLVIVFGKDNVSDVLDIFQETQEIVEEINVSSEDPEGGVAEEVPEALPEDFEDEVVDETEPELEEEE